MRGARNSDTEDPWLPTLRKLKGRIGRDGVEGIATYDVFDAREIPVRHRASLTTRQYAAVVSKHMDQNIIVENRPGASTRRAYVVYNGQQLLGSFVLNEATDEALAWNASRCFVGQFKGYKAAARGTRRAAATEQHAAEARRRLADPNPPFVTGLSEHFLRHGR